jgi:hypothetical protein
MGRSFALSRQPPQPDLRRPAGVRLEPRWPNLHP